MTDADPAQTDVDLSPPAVRLEGPEDLLDLVPYLLGFQPSSSVVLVALERYASPYQPVAPAIRRVGAAARLDLSGIELDPASLSSALRAIARSAEAVVAIVYYDEPSSDPLPVVAVVEEIERIAADLGIGLRDALLARGSRWWSYLCSDPSCCPAEGRARRTDPAPAVAAAAFAGLSALPDRASLQATLDPAPLVDRESRRPTIAALERTWATAPDATTMGTAAKRAIYARVRQRSVEGALDFVPPRPLPARQIAEFGAALAQLEVRDACWLAMEARRLPISSLWIELARELPAPYDAQPMFLHGWQAWRQGSGALAAMAAQRALDSDPGCTAAQLLLDSVAHGLDPRRTPRLRSGRAPGARRRRGVTHRTRTGDRSGPAPTQSERA